MADRDELRRALLSIVDVDEPVVIRMRHEPGPAAARLLVTLGAGWIVDENAAPCVRDCRRKECMVSVSLPPRHPLSPQKARALARAGALREAEPDGRELLDRMDRGEPVTYPGQFDASGFVTSDEVAKEEAGLEEREPEAESHPLDEAVIDSVEARGAASEPAAWEAVRAPSRSSSPVRGQTHKTARWTRDAVIQVIQAYVAEHGFPPSSHDWRTSTDDHPNASWVKKLFGSWADAIVEAGFERPTRGGSRKERRKRASGSTIDSSRERAATRAGAPALLGQEGPRSPTAPDGMRDDQAPRDKGTSAAPNLFDDFPDETKDAYATALIAAARAFADTLEEELALL